jgi:hypothetical protein
MNSDSAVPKNRSPGSQPIASSSTGRASSTAAAGPPPAATLTGDPWSHFLRPSLSATSLADRREVVGVIAHAVQHGGPDLDFGNVSAAALKAVPGAALTALARQVSRIRLPAGLDALPRCLNRLPRLRSIEMAGCTALQIDVTRWDLDTLTITGRTELRWIDANEKTSVSCPAPGIRRKVCVNVYRDGKLVGHTAAGSRRYIKVPARREVNHNGVYTMRSGELAVCRHITTWWFGARAARRAEKLRGELDPSNDMYSALANRRSFQKAIARATNQRYHDAFSGATRNLLVGNDKFGLVIEKEFRRMRRGDIPATSQFQMNSNTHAMGLELKVKNGRNGKPEYSLVFYDPNMSESHVRIKYHQCSAARNLTVTGLLQNSEINTTYFGDHPPVVTLFDLDSVQPGKKRSLKPILTDREKASPLALNLAIIDRFDGAARDLIKELRAMPDGVVDWKSLLLATAHASYSPLLIAALDADLSLAAQSLVELAVRLSSEGALDKTELLHFLQEPLSGEARPWTPLCVACSNNKWQFIDQLIHAMVQPEADGLASAAQYESLLENGGRGRPSPYACAIRSGSIGAAASMVEGMLRLTSANRISRDQFTRLVAFRDPAGLQAIERAFARGEPDLVVAVMNPIVRTATVAFAPWETAEILAAARADGTPALRATYRAGRANFLAAYGQLVLSAVSNGRILPLDAIMLLTAARPEETPCEALRALAPRGDMLVTLGGLLHDRRVATWLPDDLSDALDEMLGDDPVDTLSTDFDSSSESSSLE